MLQMLVAMLFIDDIPINSRFLMPKFYLQITVVVFSSQHHAAMLNIENKIKINLNSYHLIKSTTRRTVICIILYIFNYITNKSSAFVCDVLTHTRRNRIMLLIKYARTLSCLSRSLIFS